MITDDFSAELLAYPDICQLSCSNPCCSGYDWELCAESGADCGLYSYAPNNGAFLKNTELRKYYARHLGGCNIGFADGHAAWMNSQAILNSIQEGDMNDPTGELEPWGPTSDDDWSGGYLADEGMLIW